MRVFIVVLILIIQMCSFCYAFDSRFLAIGETNHRTSHGLDLLIKEVSNVDDSVKRIFIEGPRDYKQLYIDLSISSQSEDIITTDSKYYELICHPLWINQVTRLFPIVREINRDRIKRGVLPLLVIPIDGAKSEDITNMKWVKVDDNNLFVSDACLVSVKSVIQDSSAYFWLASYEREAMTANIFLNELKHLTRKDKAIIFYHQGHLFKNVKTCIPRIVDDKIDVSPRFGSWLQLALEKQKIDVHVVAIDHEPIKDHQQDMYLYGVMNSNPEKSNHINDLFHIFYHDQYDLFDSVENMSNSDYYWLHSIENRFSNNVWCERGPVDMTD